MIASLPLVVLNSFFTCFVSQVVMTDFPFVFWVHFFAFLTGLTGCIIIGFARWHLVVPTGLEPVFPP